MLTQLSLTNFGPLTNIRWNGLGAINLVIGNNASGKTVLLNPLYCAIRTLEEYDHGKGS